MRISKMIGLHTAVACAAIAESGSAVAKEADLAHPADKSAAPFVPQLGVGEHAQIVPQAPEGEHAGVIDTKAFQLGEIKGGGTGNLKRHSNDHIVGDTVKKDVVKS